MAYTNEKFAVADIKSHSRTQAAAGWRGAAKYSGNLFKVPEDCRMIRGLHTTTMSSSGNQAFGAKAATAKAAVSDLESMIPAAPSPDRVCAKLAQIFRVHRSEVALLRSEMGSLRFIFPPELRSAGVLPLSGSAVAARTAATRTSLLSNTFMRVKHASLFEAVKLGGDEEDRSMEQMPIQKIMSVPVVESDGNVIGVVQVSRKGLDGTGAGADFTGEDLKRLEQAAAIVARMPFMTDAT